MAQRRLTDYKKQFPLLVNPMKKRALLSGMLAVVITASGFGAWYTFNAEQEADSKPESELFSQEVQDRARELQDKIMSFDARITIPLDFNTTTVEANIDTDQDFDLVKAEKGGLSGAALAIFGWPEMWTGPNAPHKPTPGMLEAARHHQEMRYKIVNSLVRDYPDQVGIAYTPDDFKRLNEENKFAIVISMLNAYPLGDDISELDKWAARGMRLFGFNYVGNNAWSDSSRPMPFFNDTPDAFEGLSDIGKQAVHRLNDLGVIIDVSQMSSMAVRDVIELTRAPVIASHSVPRAIVDIPRNLSDKELQLIKQTGGVVHIVGYSNYLKPLSSNTLDRLNQLREEFNLTPLHLQRDLANAHMPGDPIIAIWSESKFGEYAGRLYEILEEEPRSSLSDYVDAIDYAVKKVGIDHVGISSDFNDGGGVERWENVADIQNVTAALIQRGYSDADIEKLWSGNFLRVWEDVQSLAAPQAQVSR